MITGLDHIAIAVPDLEAAIERFMTDFQLDYEGTEPVEAAKTSTAFFPLPPSSIELVHPLRGEGPIANISKNAEAAFITFASEPTTSTPTLSV